MFCCGLQILILGAAGLQIRPSAFTNRPERKTNVVNFDNFFNFDNFLT